MGQQWEIETLQTALEDALTGRSGLVMLVGEPGIGKTRTAQQFAMHAAQRPAILALGARPARLCAGSRRGDAPR